jgi:hypothetical protein
MPYVSYWVTKATSKIVLAYMFTAVYADHDLGHYGSTTRHYAAPLYVMPMALYANSSPDACAWYMQKVFTLLSLIHI